MGNTIYKLPDDQYCLWSDNVGHAMSYTCDLCDNDYTHSLSCPRGDLRELPYGTVFTASMARRIELALGLEPITEAGDSLTAWWDCVAVPQGFMPYAEWKATDNGTVSGVMINALIRMAKGREQ